MLDKPIFWLASVSFMSIQQRGCSYYRQPPAAIKLHECIWVYVHTLRA